MRANFVVVLCVMACGCQTSSGSDSGGSVDAPVLADAPADTPPDAPADTSSDAGPMECNTLTNVGTVIPQMFVATDAVTGTGGTIATGTYVLTAAVVYTGPGGGTGATGTTFQDTLALMGGGLYERVVTAMGGPDGTLRQNGTYTTAGTSIEVTTTCPPSSQPFTSYDSDGTIVRIYAPPMATLPGLMFEYTRQ